MKKKMKFIANLITVSRAIGAIILPFIFFNCGGFAAAILATVVFITDALDGMIARKYKVSTFFGAYLDTFCDKFLAIIALISLAFKSWIAIMPILFELVIVMSQYSNFEKGKSVATNYIGKTKTLFLGIALVSALFIADKFSEETLLINLFLIFLPVFLMQIITALSYIYPVAFNKVNNFIRSLLKREDMKIKSKADEINKYQMNNKKDYEWKSLKEILKDFYSEEFYELNQGVSLKRLLTKPKK